MKLPQSAQKIIELWPLGFVATVTAGGRPSVSPKGTFLVLDDETIAFGEIRSPQTVTNLQTQPELEVNFVDQFTRKRLLAWELRLVAFFVVIVALAHEETLTAYAYRFSVRGFGLV